MRDGFDPDRVRFSQYCPANSKALKTSSSVCARSKGSTTVLQIWPNCTLCPAADGSHKNTLGLASSDASYVGFLPWPGGPKIASVNSTGQPLYGDFRLHRHPPLPGLPCADFSPIVSGCLCPSHFVRSLLFPLSPSAGHCSVHRAASSGTVRLLPSGFLDVILSATFTRAAQFVPLWIHN